MRNRRDRPKTDRSDSPVTIDDDRGILRNDVRDQQCSSASSPASKKNDNASTSNSVNGVAVYDTRKDDRYWERRRKNNEAAKRSREKRRMNDIVMEKRIVELSNENTRLRSEIERLRRLYNISEVDVVLALGSSGQQSAKNSASGSRGVGGSCVDASVPTQLAANEQGNSKHRSTIRELSRKCDGEQATSSCGFRTFLDVTSTYSDTSSISSCNDDEAERLPPLRKIAHASSCGSSVGQKTGNRSSAARKSMVKTDLQLDQLPSITNSGAKDNINIPTTAFGSSECDLLSAENGNLARSFPDLVAMLGMLQSMPLLQALVKSNQIQSAPTAQQSVLQQLTSLQQLTGYNASLLSSTPCSSQLTSPPLSTASNSTPSSHHVPLANVPRNSAILDLSCKPSVCDVLDESESVDAGQLVEENHTLRVELDHINAQVRELKEMLLQQDTQTIVTTRSNSKRHSNTAALADDTSSEDCETAEQVAYSKHARLAIVDDMNCN